MPNSYEYALLSIRCVYDTTDSNQAQSQSFRHGEGSLAFYL